MKKIFAITTFLLAIGMLALLISVMAASCRSEREIESLDKLIASYETAKAKQTWVRIEADDNTVSTTEAIRQTAETTVPETDAETTEEETAAEDVADILLTEKPAAREEHHEIYDIRETVPDDNFVYTEPYDEVYSYPTGDVLNPDSGINYYYGTLETYYNLDMSGVVDWMHSLGYDYEYWVREDGVKMFGPYVMVAADYGWMPKGSILETSLGLAMVCDTGEGGWYWTDIAVDW